MAKKAASRGNSKTPKQNINTEGGASIGGNVSIGDNSKFVGRDDYSRSSFRHKSKHRIDAQQKTSVSILSPHSWWHSYCCLRTFYISPTLDMAHYTSEQLWVATRD
jgi:hypothetical protein